MRDKILQVIQDALLPSEGGGVISEQTKLIGSQSGVDSLNLVRICLALEDYANENGKEFVYTSDSTLSETRSMFKDVGSLIDEFIKQTT
ncbi:MAG: acyl carrier protein [Alphaproteobacteria bacterium]